MRPVAPRPVHSPRSGRAARSGPVRQDTRHLEWLNFLVADVQTGVGPLVAAYLAARHWDARSTGFALTFGGLVTVAAGPFAGAWIDRSKNKRGVIAAALVLLAVGALLLTAGTRWGQVMAALALVGGAGAVIGPALAAITLGMVGPRLFDRQFGRNQSFNSAGNVATALLLGGVSYVLGGRSMFVVAALLAAPALLVLRAIDPKRIDNEVARGDGGAGSHPLRNVHAKEGTPNGTGKVAMRGRDAGEGEQAKDVAEPWWRVLFLDRTFTLFAGCAFLFHLANAAMLPELGEMLAHGRVRLSAPFMSACIIVTQVVIALSASRVGRMASVYGRKPLLLVGFGVLPVRGALYAVTHAVWALIGIQVLDGVANAIFGVVSILVVSDLMQRTGRFNLAQGALGTAVGLGAALSNGLGGWLAHGFGFSVSFLGLAGVALVALALLWIKIPETGIPPDGPAARPAVTS